MDRKVVGMLCSYPKMNLGDWQWSQTPQPFGCWGQIQMEANAAKPDFLLLYQFDFYQQEPSQLDTGQLFRGLPQERIIYLRREPPFKKHQEQIIKEYQQAKNYCGYISGPDHFAPVPDYMPAIWYLSNSFQDLNEAPPPMKIGSCSWITSGIARTANHQRRLAFLRKLEEEKVNFVLYGRNLPEWCNSRGTVGNKWNVMAPYYYNLAIENYAENEWYVSEKLWDALLAWCLPIYYGGSAADKLLPPGSFLRLPSLDEQGIAYIKEVTANPQLWHEHRPQIAEARQIILHKLNLLNWLSDFVENFVDQ
ncbi:MAG: glycosyltransferase [Symploca sp. SIO2D2]|nr:glycosyltransferase [Symploca sp. SIO2D2]